MEFEQYKKVSAAVDVVFLTAAKQEADNARRASDIEILTVLVKRTEEPFNGMWALPGGFIDADKSIEEAVSTKLLNKTGISSAYLEQIYTYGNVNRDPRGRILSVAYVGMTGECPTLSDDAKLFRVVKQTVPESCIADITFEQVDTGETITELAFDHKKIFAETMQRIKGKMMYTDILKNMMPASFTLGSLEQLYRKFRGETVYGFRAFIEKKVEPTGETIAGKAHRPAQLFRFK